MDIMADRRIKSVAIIGAGASGAITAAALAAEDCFDRIRVFERRATPGGTWIYDATPNPDLVLSIKPGALPPTLDPPLRIPSDLPMTTAPSSQERFEKTPIYDDLTTNVPDIAMSFSDEPFAYGPFVPHHIPRQYIETYFSTHRIDEFLVLGTTVEDVSKVRDGGDKKTDRWRLTLRRYDGVRNADEWWEEEFDAVVIANGHYAVPFIPDVKGLPEYISRFPDRITHSKTYRTARQFAGKKVLVIGNSASGHDVTAALVSAAAHPVYQSRRSASRWDGSTPPEGIEWKPVIHEFLESGRIVFEDGSVLDDVEAVIYCTGYKASFPFWNARKNGAELWDYAENRVRGNYLHTFLPDFESVALIGVPRVLTFRGFEYQAIAVARVFAGRARGLWGKGIEKGEMRRWEEERRELVKKEKRKFHDIVWENGETVRWFERLFEIAGLGTLVGEGRVPPVLGERVRWAIEHVRKYPEPGKDKEIDDKTEDKECKRGWVVVERGEGERKKDLLSFI